MMQNCNELADYEFTDYTSEQLTYTLATTCSKHCDEMEKIVGKAQKMAFNIQRNSKSKAVSKQV